LGYSEINAETIDRWVQEGWEWGVPSRHEEFLPAKDGRWAVKLTPVKPVPAEWFPEMEGTRVLWLASGGGQQMPIFAALGAVCTVLDYSPRQIESESMVAEREGYSVEAVRADMTEPLPFADESFDLIFHPVANCYIEEVSPSGGVFPRAQKGRPPDGRLDNGNQIFFLTTRRTLPSATVCRSIRSKIPHDGGAAAAKRRLSVFPHAGGADPRAVEAGFSLRDLYEDTNGSGRSMNTASDVLGDPCG
jgi:SAM-dependent methyltransferase